MKKQWVLCALSLAAAMLLMLTSINLSAPDAERGPTARVALLTENENGTYYLQVKQGMRDAAGALNAELLIERMDEDCAAQAAALREDGVRAAVVLTERGDFGARMLGALSDAGVAAVSAGGAGAYAVLRDYDDDALQLVGALREAGCMRALILPDDAGLLSDALIAAWGGRRAMLLSPEDAKAALPGDGIVALTAKATRAALLLKQSGAIPADIPLLGVDTGATRADDLESGFLAGMLLEQPYTVGYLAFRLALEAAENPKVEPIAYAACRMVTPETMYLPENVKVVFPLLQ